MCWKVEQSVMQLQMILLTGHVDRTFVVKALMPEASINQTKQYSFTELGPEIEVVFPTQQHVGRKASYAPWSI